MEQTHRERGRIVRSPDPVQLHLPPWAVVGGLGIGPVFVPALAQASGTAPAAGPGSPTPAASASGWSDIGPWGILGLVVLAAIVIFMVLRARRKP